MKACSRVSSLGILSSTWQVLQSGKREVGWTLAACPVRGGLHTEDLESSCTGVNENTGQKSEKQEGLPWLVLFMRSGGVGAPTLKPSCDVLWGHLDTLDRAFSLAQWFIAPEMWFPSLWSPVLSFPNMGNSCHWLTHFRCSFCSPCASE